MSRRYVRVHAYNVERAGTCAQGARTCRNAYARARLRVSVHTDTRVDRARVLRAPRSPEIYEWTVHAAIRGRNMTNHPPAHPPKFMSSRSFHANSIDTAVQATSAISKIASYMATIAKLPLRKIVLRLDRGRFGRVFCISEGDRVSVRTKDFRENLINARSRSGGCCFLYLPSPSSCFALYSSYLFCQKSRLNSP